MQRPPLPAEHMRHADTSSAYQHRDFFERMNKGRASSVTKNYEVYEESSYYQRSTSLPRPMRGIEKHIEVSSNADLLRRRQEEEESFEVITTTASIPPERPPKIIVPLHSTVFRSGEPMVLRCRIDAVPPAQITWSKDEIDLAEWVISENITATVLPDGTYELSKPQCTTEDAGLYQCSARNAHGKAETAAYVTVEEAVSATDVHETEIHKTTVTKSPSPYIPQEPPKFTESMEAVDEGYETLLMCKLHSEAPVEISWYHDGILLQQCDKHTMGSMADGTQILTIRNVVKEDEGVYICRAESRYGVAETCTQIKATREKKQTSVEEVMIEEHDDEQIQIPQRTEFRKKAYTDTTVKVVAETEITSSEENYSRTAELRKSEEAYKLLVKVAETVASRLVAKVVIDEAIREAVYRIREETRTSDEEEIFYETIDIEEQLSAPRFETNIECYNVRAGDTVRLATDVRGHPTPTVEWYFGQQRIQQSSRTEVLYSNGRSTLLIKKATKADEGTYYCHAENRFGKSVLSCDLRVIDISKDRTQSTLDFSKAKYVSSESESEVFSNVHVNHSEETFEHHIAFLQPQTIALGYDCRASTSKVCDDSVIIRRETVAVTSEQLIPTEKEVTLNVNVEKPAPQFTHDVRILQPNEGGAFLISKEKRVVRSEEVMQTTDITLSEPQRIAHGADSTVNTSATIVIEKPTQRVLHEVTCLYDDRISLPEQRFHAVTSVEITQLQAVNELLSSVLARKDEHLAYEVANVEVRRPPSKFDHTTTVVECEIAHITAYFTAPTTATEEIIVVELSLSKCSQVRSEEITQIEQPIRRAFGEQRIVILEGSAQSFSEAVTWSLRRVRKAASISGEALTNANIEVRKPSERGEHVTTFIDSSTIMQEILAIAAAATKMKITSVFITLTKKGEVAHQALVVEYESFVQEEAALNIALLTVPAVHLKQEETWTRETKIVETHGEGNVVAVFVEVDANCPDQSVELVASVSVPVLSNENLLEVQKSSYSILEKSASISESSSLGILQAPKFLKKLKNVTSIIGNALQFKCIVSGTPMPEVRWFVDGDEIHSSVEYETVYEDGVCILRINEVVSEDEGEYTCEATNAAGRATTKCFLHTATVADYDDRQWQRSLSKKSVSEETNSYILFEAPHAEETIEVHAFVAETIEQTPVSSVYEDSQTTVATTEAFDCSSLHVFVDKEFSLGSELRNMEISAVLAETRQQIGLSLILYTSSDEQVECFFQFTAGCAEEICEVLCCCHCPEDQVRSYHMISFSDEVNLSLCMTKPCLVENASMIEIGSSRGRKASEKLAVYDECKALISKKCFSREHLQAVVLIRSENVSVQLSVAVPGSLELDSNSGLLRNVQNFSELNLLKERLSDNVHMPIARTSSPAAIEACIESSGTDLWNERFDNPFPQEASQVQSSDEEKLYEPRTPLLPQRVTYKGREVGLSVHEIGKVICRADEKNIKPDRQVIERCVEAIFDFGSTIKECTEERTSKRQELKGVRGAEYASKVVKNKVVERSAELLERNASSSGAGFISKDAEGTVMTEEDIDMFQEDEISELILEIIDETEERSKIEELSETNVAEENEFVSCCLRKLSIYGEAVENRGIQIPAQSDQSAKPSVDEKLIPQALQEHMSSQRALSELEECNYLKEIRRTAEIVRRVETELGSMQVVDSSSSLCEGARRIERAIYDVSDRIVKQQPVTEAQAAANEELLRTTLEEVIMDVPVSSNEECRSVYKKPIAFLKQKLTDFENSFIVDEEIEVIADSAENGKPKGFPTTASAVSGISDEQNVAKSTKKVIAKRMSSEFARMTPITANIQQQLSALETMLDESELEELEDRDEMATEETKLLRKEPTAKRREMHSILVQINHELNTVKRYCQKNSKKGTDAIVGVLNKVRNHVASTVNLVSRSKKRRSRTASPDKHVSKSGFFFRTDASINFNLFKKQSDECINVVVVYRSASEKPVCPAPQNNTVDSEVYQCGYKLSAGSIEKTPTPKSELNVVIFTGSSRTDSAGCTERVATTSFGTTDAAAPIPPPRHCRSNIYEGDVPIRPPRPRRSQSKEVDEKKVTEMLIHGGTHSEPFVTAEHDAVQRAEISQLQEQLRRRIAELDGQSASFTCSDGVINETEVQELQVRRRSSAENVFTVLAFAPHRRAFFTTLDETSSVQLICEESDYGNESDTGSRTIFGSAKVHPAYALHEESIPEVNEKCLLEDLSKIPTKGCEHTPSITQHCWSDDPIDFRKVSVSASEGSANLSHKSENVDVEVDIIFRQRSESFHEDDIGIVHITRDTDQISSTSNVYMRPDIVETSSLNDIESLLGKDEQSEEASDIRIVCSTNATLSDMVSIMSTIMETSEISKTNSSAMTASRSSATTATTTDSLLPRIGHIEKSEGSQTSSFLVANPYVREEEGTSEEFICHCSAKNGEKAEENLEARDDSFEEVCLNLKWKRPFQKYKVLCTLSPDIRMGLHASAAVGEYFEVEVEQPSESQGYLIRITDDVSDSICLSLMEVVAVTVDVEVSLSNDEQTDFEEVIAVQPERYKLLMCNAGILNSASNGNIPLLEDNTGVSVSIIARSIHDIVYASLEEIPWGEVSMHVYLTDVELARSTSHCDSENRTNSLIQNVTVSELNENERKSLRSQESFKSSQRSLAFSDRTDRYDSMQSLNIPSYMLKEGSTATITCELNNFLSPSSQIDWFKGRVKVETVAGKIDRISHDLLEVLVISHVELADSDLYSIQVDDQVYPVACIIVEEESQVEKQNEATPIFLSPPQTLFVMEGQPAIISCQISEPGQNIVWYKEKKAIGCSERLKIESDDNGFHRLIIEDSELEDQGTYCAYLGNQFTSITLVVEEQIDEKELTITASGTESEEDDFREYVVPPGSTATIACELEKSDEIRELIWRKDGKNILFNDDAKMEHVVNGLKHYLVIHDTQPSDSASYSVRINNAEFKVAHMTVSDYATSVAGKRAKRISNSSLQHF
uniref:Titin n=1 Tax=Parascaris univalens TaxID=6257 RepID=A0A914ZVR6_PARUN